MSAYDQESWGCHSPRLSRPLGMLTPAFTILVVDECPAVRLFVDLAVGSDDVHVVGVRDGYAALKCLDDVRPNLVVASAALTGLGTPDFVATLARRGVPVALVANGLDRTEFEPSAAIAVLARPLQVASLRALVPPVEREEDPVDAWMGAAESSLGSVPGWWPRACADAGFEGDVNALRAGLTRTPLVVTASQFVD